MVASKTVDLEKLQYPSHLDTPEVRQALNEFIKYRRELGKPLKTNMSLQKTLNAFSKLRAADLLESINVAIQMEWMGVFPSKKNGTQGTSDWCAAAGKPVSEMTMLERHQFGVKYK